MTRLSGAGSTREKGPSSDPDMSTFGKDSFTMAGWFRMPRVRCRFPALHAWELTRTQPMIQKFRQGIVYAPYIPFYTTPTLFGDDDMREVTANKETLLTKLRSNREIHILAFQEARSGWLDAAQTALRARATEISNLSGDAELPNLFVGGIDELSNDTPISHVKDYDRAIAMLEIHTEETITLSADDVGRYVLDQWNWSENFFAATTKYSSH